MSQTAVAIALDRWRHRSPSSLSDHAGPCCTAARAWFGAMALSRPPCEGEPVWVSRRHRWGPSPWPLFWCEAVTRETLDCGALAALALEAFRVRGVPVFHVQLVERVPAEWIAQWNAAWEASRCPADWIREELAYHEACGVLQGRQLSVWDPTDASWRKPDVTGSAGIVAVRSLEPEGLRLPQTLIWSGLELKVGEWLVLPWGKEVQNI